MRVVAGLLVPALADRLDRRRAVTIVVCGGPVGRCIYLAHLGHHRGSRRCWSRRSRSGTTMAGIGPIAEALGIAASRAWDFPYAPGARHGLDRLPCGQPDRRCADRSRRQSAWRSGGSSSAWRRSPCSPSRHPGAHRVQGRAPPTLREIGRVVVNPTFAVFMAAVACLQSSHAVIYALGLGPLARRSGSASRDRRALGGVGRRRDHLPDDDRHRGRAAARAGRRAGARGRAAACCAGAR